MKPTFVQSAKHRMIQSSNSGTLMIQNGSVFKEGGSYVGPAPVWGPDLFLENGLPIDPYAKVLSFAQENYKEPEPEPVSREPLPLSQTIEDVFEGSPLDEHEEIPELGKPRKGRSRKDSRGPGYGSRPV